MHPYKLALAASTALMASSSLSFAAIISQTESYSHLTDWGTTPSTANFGPTKTIGFAGFNPSLGTLNSVTISITETVDGTVDLHNKSGSGTTSVTGSLINSLKYIYPTIAQKSLGLESTTFQDPSLAGGASSGPHSVSGSTTASHTVTSGLAAFEASWLLTVGDLGQVLVNSGNGNGSATYTDIGGVKIVASHTLYPCAAAPAASTPAAAGCHA